MQEAFRILLGLGGNIGNKAAKIREAVTRLEMAGVEIGQVSGLYKTPPWGITEQEEFLNAVAKGTFRGTPQQLLEIALRTEDEMGRERIIKWGPRIIDIDLLDFHQQIIDQENLKLPHPFIAKRPFVLIPLAEIEPDFEVAPTGKTAAELVAALPEKDRQEIEWVAAF